MDETGIRMRSDAELVRDAAIAEAEAQRKAAIAAADAAYEAAVARADDAYRKATGEDPASLDARNLGAAFAPVGLGGADRPARMKRTPRGFTTGLAFFDFVPVALFGAATLLLAQATESRMLLLGAILCLAAGGLKALWKVAITVMGVDEWRLNRQFVILMPAGFLAMIAALFLDLSGPITLDALVAGAMSLPVAVFLALWVAGMVAMGVLGHRLDSDDARANWIEELVNAAAQGCLLIAVLCML